MVLWMLLYVVCSASGLTLMKKGLGQGLSIGTNQNIIHFEISALLLIGIALYVISFILSLFIMSKLQLTYYYPISASLVYIFVCLMGVMFLGEKMQIAQYIGGGLMLIGIVVFNLNRQ